MSANVLLSDASVPLALRLSGFLRSGGSSTVLLVDRESESSESIDAIRWNRPSILSSKTVLLDACNRFGFIDALVFVFDIRAVSLSIASSSDAADPASAMRIIDDYIRGPLLLVSGFAAYFREMKKGNLCFVHVENRNEDGPFVPLACSVAERAFVTLAEEISRSFASSTGEGLSVSLVRYDGDDEDAAIESIAVKVLAPAARSHADSRWVKVGSRGLFGKA
jgi:hypothetical protein